MSFRLTYCHNATLGRRDFYRQLCLALSPKATAASVFYTVTTQVQELAHRACTHLPPRRSAPFTPRRPRPPSCPAQLRMGFKALLSIVLVGMLELDDRLALGAHRPLLSRLHARLHARLHLDPVNLDDSQEYLRYRLKLAGCDKELLPRDTTALLHEASGGTHREARPARHPRAPGGCPQEAPAQKKPIDNWTIAPPDHVAWARDAARVEDGREVRVEGMAQCPRGRDNRPASGGRSAGPEGDVAR